jgi:uncharacterized membrane protein YkvI
MIRWIKTWILPGAVFQSVLVGGGYGTGREVVEFISRFGPLGGLKAVLLVGVLWALVLAVTFELARRFQTPDYRTFFKVLLGRYWPFYELFFAAALLIVLAVCGAAAGAVLNDSFGMPALVGIAVMLVIVGVLNYYGRALVEKTLTLWGLAMTVVFVAFGLLTFLDRGERIADAFDGAQALEGWGFSGFQFFLYNIGVAPAILYVTGHLETRGQALGAGIVAGLLGLLPALVFHLVFMAGFPEIIDKPLPTYWMLQQLGFAWLLVVYVILLFGTIAQTGVGMLQGLNERLDVWWSERHGRGLSSRAHSLIALGTVLASLLLANVGIVDLVAKGYGTLAWFVLVIYVIPVLTLGLFKLRDQGPATSEAQEPLP